jgi:outer membrane protein
VKVARAQLYPTISAFGSLGSSYVNLKNPQFGPGPIVATGATVTINNVPIDVIAPTTIITGYTTRKFARQYKDNFAQAIGLGLSVPIFNGRVARTAWERSKVSVRNLELTKELGDQTLKQDIYKAYIDATSAIQKFNANRKGVEISQKAYDYAQKRYDVGLLSTYDLLITQNSLLTAKTNLLYAQYDYVFKMKLLEFYKGQGLKL